MPQQAWEIQDLGMQATQRIVTAADPLRTMQTLSQNFPVLAQTLLGTTVPESLTEQLEANQKLLGNIGLAPGSSLLAVNGIILDTSGVDLHHLLRSINHHSSLVAKLDALGVPPATIDQVVKVQ